MRKADIERMFSTFSKSARDLGLVPEGYSLFLVEGSPSASSPWTAVFADADGPLRDSPVTFLADGGKIGMSKREAYDTLRIANRVMTAVILSRSGV